MADGPGDPVELYRARGLPEAHALRVLLEAEGIPVWIDNELLQGAVGELPLGWATAPRVMVDHAHAPAARAVLAAFLRRSRSRDGGEESPLRCLACRAPMGDADTCPACGWSYVAEESETDETAEAAPGAEPPGSTGPTSAGADQPAAAPAEAEGPPPLSGRAAWAEVAAVLAVGVVPNLFGAVAGAYAPSAPMPYWLDALHLAGLSGCTIFVTLYLIHRSGEPWERFGITRPRASDVALGLALLAVAYILLLVAWAVLPSGGAAPAHFFPRPRGPVDHVLVVAKYAASAFAEELVLRAYLVTRLAGLLRSPTKAVVLAAVVFASYHLYQGLSGAGYSLLFGLAYGAAFRLIGRVWPLAIGHLLYNIHAELAMP